MKKKNQTTKNTLTIQKRNHCVFVWNVLYFSYKWTFFFSVFIWPDIYTSSNPDCSVSWSRETGSYTERGKSVGSNRVWELDKAIWNGWKGRGVLIMY